MQLQGATIRRIGREPTPAEKTYQYVLENPHVLEHAARNHFGDAEGLIGIHMTARWEALRESEREEWRTRTLADFAVRAGAEPPHRSKESIAPSSSILPQRDAMEC